MTAVPYWASDAGDVQLFVGDCLDVLRTLPADSVDAIVTDPPAGVAFMSRTWDTYGSRARFVEWLTERLCEALRVLKPGGHALVWSLPRTSHWTAWAVEDAGFEVRDCVLHMFGSGMPKGLDVSKAIDKAAGAEREVIGEGDRFGRGSMRNRSRVEAGYRPTELNPDGGAAQITAPATPDAARWAGWNVALKPGQEMWWLARKPLEAGSVAANVLRYGTGALNIDACKVAHASEADLATSQGKNPGRADKVTSGVFGADRPQQSVDPAGRWPANLVFTHSESCDGVCAESCPVGELDRQSGVSASRSSIGRQTPKQGTTALGDFAGTDRFAGHDDAGGASRFYPVFKYQAKAPASERPRLEDGEAHPTVKPLGFISWACRLITPPGGTVLDMFCGSGVVGEAAIVEGFRCILIDQERKSADLTRKRLGKPIQPVMFGLDAS